MRKFYKMGCLSLAVMLLMVGGCARKATNLQEQTKLAKSLNRQNMDFQVTTERKLTAVAEAIEHSLAELAAIERVRTPPEKKLVAVNSAELQGKVVTLDWNGPVAPLLRQVAKLANCQLRVLGKVPAVPILVSVSGHDMPVVELLRNIDLQCGQRARIAILSKQKVIELRYHE